MKRLLGLFVALCFALPAEAQTLLFQGGGGASLAPNAPTTCTASTLLYADAASLLQCSATIPFQPTFSAGILTGSAGVNKVAITAPATAATLTIANNKTLTVSNSLTLAGTDATTLTFPTTSQTIPGLGQANAWTQNGALSSGTGPSATFTGTWITGGTTTTNKPMILIEPTGTLSNNWNANGTGLGINAVSGFTGLLIDIQVAGAGKFNVNNGGTLGVAGGGNFSADVTSTASFWTKANTGASAGFYIGSGADVSLLRTGALAATFNSALTLSSSLLNTGITSDATHTDATVCVDTTSKQFYSGSGAVGICLGTSSARYKSNILPLTAGLADLSRIQAVSYRYLPGYGDPDKKLYGFTAEQVDGVLPELVGLDADGRPNSVDWAGLVPVIVNAIKELKADNDSLRAEISKH